MPPAVPKLIQRFRARELQRLVDVGGLREPRRGGTNVFMKNVNVNHVRMGTPMHNPFLPRPFISSKPSTSAEQQKKERKMWVQPKYSLRRQADLIKAARASGTLHLLPPGPKLSVEELDAAKREMRKRARLAKQASVMVEERIARAKVAKSTVKTEETVSTEIVETSQTTVTSSLSQRVSRTKRRRWVLKRPHELVLRRNSAKAGYPGVVFRWTGKVPTKSRVGLTIYEGRRRMFKGHKWERHLEKRRGQIAVRMRDMPGRISRFKNVSYALLS